MHGDDVDVRPSPTIILYIVRWDDTTKDVILFFYKI